MGKKSELLKKRRSEKNFHLKCRQVWISMVPGVSIVSAYYPHFGFKILYIKYEQGWEVSSQIVLSIMWSENSISFGW